MRERKKTTIKLINKHLKKNLVNYSNSYVNKIKMMQKSYKSKQLFKFLELTYNIKQTVVKM